MSVDLQAKQTAAMTRELLQARKECADTERQWKAQWDESEQECKRLRERVRAVLSPSCARLSPPAHRALRCSACQQTTKVEMQLEKMEKLSTDRIEAARKAERLKLASEQVALREEVRRLLMLECVRLMRHARGASVSVRIGLALTSADAGSASSKSGASMRGSWSKHRRQQRNHGRTPFGALYPPDLCAMRAIVLPGSSCGS